MIDFQLHTVDTAPEGSRERLAQLEATRGSIGSMFGALAASPAMLNGYLDLGGRLMGDGVLSRADQTWVMLTASREQGCRYCVPVYSRAAEQQGLDAETVRSIRNGEPVADPRAAALSDITAALVRQRGQVSDETVQAFLDAGFGHAELLEVLGGIALKTITNYLTQFASVPLDDGLVAYAWAPGEAG